MDVSNVPHHKPAMYPGESKKGSAAVHYNTVSVHIFSALNSPLGGEDTKWL